METADHLYCLYCRNTISAWLPYGLVLSEFVRRVRGVGSNLDRFQCPSCGSTDRERHLRLYLEASGGLNNYRAGAILHFAPELAFSRYLVATLEPARHVQGDLTPTVEGIERINVEAIDYPAAVFDLAVCNHVLEHVVDPVAALRELYRVLKPGGRLICQTPFARGLSRTFEDPSIVSQDDREFFYGQSDHVRIFGTDIVTLIRSAGFRGELREHSTLLPAVDPLLAGVNEHEPFFDFVKPR